MSLSSKTRFEIFKRDNFTCQYCGRQTPAVILEIDHIKPKCEGGDDDQTNLTTSCWECNRGKGGTPLDTLTPAMGDIHAQTVELAEREMQLREYNEVRHQQRAREDAEIDQLKKHWVTIFGDYEKCFPANIIRKCLRIMHYIDIWEYIDYVDVRIDGRTMNWTRANNGCRYLCGILRNKLRDTEGFSDGSN